MSTFFHHDDHRVRPLQRIQHSCDNTNTLQRCNGCDVDCRCVHHHKVNTILPPSNGDDKTSGPSSAPETISPPRTLSNVMRYTIRFIIAAVVSMSPATFHKITPSLASDGDLAHTLPSSTVETCASIVSPPKSTQWAIITIASLLYSIVASHVIPVRMLTALLLPITPLSRRSSATDTILLRRQCTSATRRTVSIVLVIIAITPPLQHLTIPTIIDFSTHDDSFQTSNSHIDYETAITGKSCFTSPSTLMEIWEALRITGMLTGSRFPNPSDQQNLQQVGPPLLFLSSRHRHFASPSDARCNQVRATATHSDLEIQTFEGGYFREQNQRNTKKSGPGQALWGGYR
ncbi:hypothetical protein IW262DRAFT_215950 [Armillaria fumosa]|nr:hypothetical protein IW262DRAFT_215950 [Armillaria fumosa]